MDKKRAHAFTEAQKIFESPYDQKKFVEIVETELLNLHEGNIARYKINHNRNMKSGPLFRTNK